jgi:hypothetical protein
VLGSEILSLGQPPDRVEVLRFTRYPTTMLVESGEVSK